jgi:hypothetical protein
MGGSPKDPAKPSAPISERTIEVAEAGRQQRRDMQKKQGFLSTLFAGSPQSAGKTQLGGGQ